jgi:phenylpropionate dioxygenase-like ring-hydroxylating dioxygenase large terminal subunit
MWLRNCWQVAAFSREVVGGQLFARRICDEPIVLYRSMTGAPVALEDRCAHRAAPLSMGALIGDTLRCGYHGLCYDTTGKCVTIPGQDYIPQRARVRAYPALEKHRLVWIWMGDPERAEQSTVPDVHWLDDPRGPPPRATTTSPPITGLLNDNLLDLSHETYVHTRRSATRRSPSRRRRSRSRTARCAWSRKCPAARRRRSTSSSDG